MAGVFGTLVKVDTRLAISGVSCDTLAGEGSEGVGAGGVFVAGIGEALVVIGADSSVAREAEEARTGGLAIEETTEGVGAARVAGLAAVDLHAHLFAVLLH